MGFLIRIEPLLRVSEYIGKTADGNDYCIASWKVKNVADGTVMLVSCFTKDDQILKDNMHATMDATLTIVCRDWNKNGKSGSMNNVNLTNVIAPISDGHGISGNSLPLENIVPVSGDVFNPAAHSDDLPFNVGFSVIP